MSAIDDSLYFAGFSWQATKGLLRPHGLKIPDSPIIFEEPFYFTTEMLHKWNAVFNVAPETRTIPFSFYWRISNSSFLKTLGQLGVNFKNVLHLGQERNFPDPDRRLEVGRVYKVQGALKDLCYLSKDRVILVTETIVRDTEGHVVNVGFDYVFIRNVPLKCTQKIQNHPDYNRHNISEFQELKRRGPTLSESTHSHRLHFPENLGRRFGVISGDLNPVHMYKPLARAFGQKHHFAHGACVANYALKFFSHDLHERVREFRITFSRPANLGQNILIKYDKQNFEMLDKTNAVVAFGKRLQHDL